tara:strand:+ start:12 stop:218 length:207 start_codon:yes stop_codon:yes gene_type:complete
MENDQMKCGLSALAVPTTGGIALTIRLETIARLIKKKIYLRVIAVVKLLTTMMELTALVAMKQSAMNV